MNASVSSLLLLLILFGIIVPTQGRLEVSTEILTLIKEGRTIQDRIIEGDLIFDNKSNNITTDSEIRIINCTINGTIDFRRAKIKKQIYLIANKFNGPILANDSTGFNDDSIFKDCKFNNKVYFGGAIFNKFASFSNSTFANQADFRDVKFEKDADFRLCRFNDFLYFDNANFSENADFNGDKFNEKASFSSSRFKGDASFLNLNSKKWIFFESAIFDRAAEFPMAKFDISKWTNCNFRGLANFNEANFTKNAYFRETSFEGLADFENSNFEADATFWSCIFNKSANFGPCDFKGVADFSNSKFKDDAEFIGVNFIGPTNSFNETLFNGELSFEDAHFTGCLYLTKTKYNKIYIRWDNIYKLGYDDAAYMALLENFKKLGMLDDADNCYYQYRKEHRSQNWTLEGQTGMLGTLDVPFRKVIDFFLDMLYAYGVSPLRPIYYSLITIIFFAFFWRAAGLGKPSSNEGNKVPQAKKSLEKVLLLKEELLGLKEPLIFSFLVFLSAAKFFVETPMPKTPEVLIRSTPWSKYAISIERILAGLLLALFFLAVSRTIVRNS